VRALVFLAALAVTVLGAAASEAQPVGKLWRIGFLGDGSRAERLAINLTPFREGLRELGYVEGQTVAIEERWSEGRAERVAELASELVRLKVDVIVTHGVRATKAAQDATRTIPIVAAVMPDPVGAGLVASLARPGGNTTGLTDQVTELAQKEIQILKEALPHVKRVAILWHEGSPGATSTFEQTRKATESMALAVEVIGVTAADQIDNAIARAARARPDALIVVHDILTVSQRARIAQAALKHGLPTICGSSPFVDAGGLLAYAPNLPTLFKRAAVFVDRIFRGAKPADIPIEQPTKFELRVNLRTARALGLTIPPSLLLRADDVIQ
jgi:putative tryptophan/tyrosine transport system substrate-binding protein